MTFLSNAGVEDTNILAAAVLHDTIEDCGVTYDDIATNFGKTVSDLVMECTDDKSLPKVERKKQQIIHAKVISNGAKLIKSADKLSNLSDLDKNPPISWSTDIINGYFAWCYAVCLELNGINSQIDAQLGEIFNRIKLTNISKESLEQMLDKYYKCL